MVDSGRVVESGVKDGDRHSNKDRNRKVMGMVIRHYTEF